LWIYDAQVLVAFALHRNLVCARKKTMKDTTLSPKVHNRNPTSDPLKDINGGVAETIALEVLCVILLRRCAAGKPKTTH